MIRTRRFFFLLIALALTDQIALAQVTTGTPPFGSFSGGPDVINYDNLNAHWAIPMIHKPGRGTDFSYVLGYDTSVWYPVGASGSQYWQPVANWGWPVDANGLTGQLTYWFTHTQTVIATCGPGGNQEIEDLYTYSNWVYTDPYGAAHTYNGSASVTVYSGCSYNTNSSSLFETAHDGSGYAYLSIRLLRGPVSPVTLAPKPERLSTLPAMAQVNKQEQIPMATPLR